VRPTVGALGGNVRAKIEPQSSLNLKRYGYIIRTIKNQRTYSWPPRGGTLFTKSIAALVVDGQSINGQITRADYETKEPLE